MPASSSAILHEEDPRASQVWGSIQRTTGFLVQNQASDGHWCGELVGDTILESETILLYAFLEGEHFEREIPPWVRQAAEYILQQQRRDGGWGQYPGSPIDVSSSVKAYWALKIAGQDAETGSMQRARQAILDAGGADQVNSFTRFFLALLGQISYECCPAVPPEMVLLPNWSPVNIYRFSAWSRTIFVPLSIVWSFRACRQLPPSCSIHELFHKPAAQWPALSNPGSGDRWRDRLIAGCFRGLDRCLKAAERMHIRPWRRRALDSAETWIKDRFRDSDGLGAIYPPIVWSLVALRCLGYDDNSQEVLEAHRQLRDLRVPDKGEDGAETSGAETSGVETLRWQPCKSPVWDTALSLRSLVANESSPTDVICRGVRWLLDREIRRRGDWAQRVDVEPAGWCFEYHNAFYPDIDDTIMVMMALTEALNRADVRRELGSSNVPAACERARRWVLAMQNCDGGWGAFDRDNDATWLCHVPFADHNAMIDPSTPDITARVLESLAITGMSLDDPPIQKAIQYLRRTQESDGSWFGRWGVNHIYGTWQVLVGLRAFGVDVDDVTIQKGADWLEAHQHASGGWGESANSYLDDAWRGRGEPTPSQTSWALLGLTAAGRHQCAASARGLDYLAERQRHDGRWEETECTGTGFPRVFYLRYDYYSVYFPLLAMAVWRQACLAERQHDESAKAA